MDNKLALEFNRLPPIETQHVQDLGAQAKSILGLQDIDVGLFCFLVQPTDKTYPKHVLVAKITGPQITTDTTAVITARDAYPQINHDGTVSPIQVVRKEIIQLIGEILLPNAGVSNNIKPIPSL